MKGGKGIWGMPKHQANLDFRVDDRTMSSQYDLDGQLCLRIRSTGRSGCKRAAAQRRRRELLRSSGAC